MGGQIRVVLIGGPGLTKGAHCVHFIGRLDCCVHLRSVRHTWICMPSSASPAEKMLLRYARARDAVTHEGQAEVV
jgi:hypothetical protein